MRPELILLEPDHETRLLVKSLLERDGYRVLDAADEGRVKDALRGSRPQALVVSAEVAEHYQGLLDELRTSRPDLDVLEPPGFGVSLVEGAAGRDGTSDFARDALLLLAILAEEGTRREPQAERLSRLAELTGLKLGLSRLNLEACSAGAAVIALGPSLAAFRFGALQQQDDAAEAGLSRELQNALAAANALRCPFDLRTILESLEEHFDGRGRPRGLTGEQIPLVSRILTVAREYSQFVANGHPPAQVADALRARSGVSYDPKVVDAFFKALRDDSYLERLEEGVTGARVLVADADEAALAVAELRLGTAGFRVSTVSDGQQAFEQVTGNNPPDVLITDTVLPRLDGISLLLKLRRHPTAKGIPLIFTSSRTDAGLLNKALKLGAKDVVAKPVNFDILAAKLKTLARDVDTTAQQSSAGVLGDLSDMPLSDFLQVLALGRRTVCVSLSSPAGQGEIYFDQGTPVGADMGGVRGVDAFCEMITWREGTFTLSQGDVPDERNLHHSLDALLLQSAWHQRHSTGHDGGGPAPYRGPGAQPAPAPAPATTPEVDFADDFAAENPYGGAAPAAAGGDPYGAPAAPAAADNPYGAPPQPPAPPPPPRSPSVDPFGGDPYEPNPYAEPTITDDIELDFGP